MNTLTRFAKHTLTQNVEKTLFFDLDGTLTDITQREIEVIHDTVNHFDLAVSKARVKRLCTEMPSYTNVFEELGLELTNDVIQYWTNAFVNTYQLSVVRKGVKSTLGVLFKKHMLVCTTSRETLEEVTEELEFFHIDRFFSHVVTRDVAAKHFGLTSIPLFPYHEQRSRLYKCALAIAKCDSENTAAIGDMGIELKPAKELGITTIGLITYEARKKGLQETSDIIISSITQLSDLAF